MEILGSGRISALSGTAKPRQTRSGRGAAERKEKAMGRFDSIMLSTSAAARGGFEAKLRSELAQEVRSTGALGNLSALREQVQSGTYRPDAMAVARQMLLLPEEG